MQRPTNDHTVAWDSQIKSNGPINGVVVDSMITVSNFNVQYIA